MSRINEIESRILALSPGAYQKLMDDILNLKYHYTNLMPYGSHSGTDKTTQGTPDSYLRLDNGSYVLIMYGTTKAAYEKLREDISSCIAKSGIPIDKISKIVCCHTSTNLSIPKVEALNDLIPNTISLQLIGLYETAKVLEYEYPTLALEHLHLALDTHQILDEAAFVSESSANRFSTSLDQPLLYRDNELAAVLEDLYSNQVTIITGPSGVGKTRLALEAGRRYTEKTNATLRFIRANDQSIYTDLQIAFCEDTDYLVVVDDANMLSEIQHLLRMSRDPARIHSLKILMTVRDYAEDKLIQEVKSYLEPAIIAPSSLGTNAIYEIIRSTYDITDPGVIEQILTIAKGNVRLAIMASHCAVQGRIEQIRNAADILKSYYAETLKQLDRNMMITAGIIAFFGSVRLLDTELPLQMARMLKIDSDVFDECCRELHGNEIVDMYEDAAVRFNNQNLCDYILYHTILLNHWIRPSFLINNAFPQFKTRIRFVFNTLLHLFYDDMFRDYLEREINSVWGVIVAGSDDTIKLTFLREFFSAIPDQTLLYIKEKIDTLPDSTFDYSAVREDNYKKVTSIQDPLLEILACFKGNVHFEDALDLVFHYLSKSIDRPVEFLYVFGHEWGLSRQSLNIDNCTDELRIITALHSRFTEHPSYCNAYCMCVFINAILKYEYCFVEATPVNEISLFQWHAKYIPFFASLREQCIAALGDLLENTDYQNHALHILYHSFISQRDVDSELLTHDIKAIELHILPKLDTARIAHCVIIDELMKLCEEHNCPWPGETNETRQNVVYRLYKALGSVDPSDRYNTEQRIKNITKAACELSATHFASLWQGINDLSAASIPTAWNMGEGIDILFSIVAERSKDEFLDCLMVYLQNNTPNCEWIQGILEGLIRHLGDKGSVEYLKSVEFIYQSRWIAELLDCIAEMNAESIDADEVMSLLKTSSPPYPISLDTAIALEQHTPGFLVRYMSVLNELASVKPNVVSVFSVAVGYMKKRAILSDS